MNLPYSLKNLVDHKWNNPLVVVEPMGSNYQKEHN